MELYAVIRIRGSVNLSPQLKKTLELLRLHKVNHLVLVKEEKQLKKMIEKIQDFVAFGEINQETLAKLVLKRGRLAGDKRIEKEFFKENKLKDENELAEKVLNGTRFEDFGLKPVFRLTPPKKGFEREGIKKSFVAGGALGYRGEKINELIKKMM